MALASDIRGFHQEIKDIRHEIRNSSFHGRMSYRRFGATLSGLAAVSGILGAAMVYETGDMGIHTLRAAYHDIDSNKGIERMEGVTDSLLVATEATLALIGVGFVAFGIENGTVAVTAFQSQERDD